MARERKSRGKSFPFLLDENSLADHLLNRIYLYIHNYVEMMGFSADWPNMFPSSRCAIQPTNHVQPTFVCPNSPSSDWILFPSIIQYALTVLSSDDLPSTSSCVPFCRLYHGLYWPLIVFPDQARPPLSASGFRALNQSLSVFIILLLSSYISFCEL
jgi:hypothetical protein